jgi:hypothetical protein
MNKIILLIFIVLLGISIPIFSLEVGTNFHIGNLAFDTSRISTDTTFTGLTFPWGVDAYVNHSVNEQIGIHVGLYMDSILRNMAFTLFTYKESFLELSVGPFFGLLNSDTTLLKSGISTSIKLEFPGIVFIRFRADSSIGGRMVQAGDYLQERNDLAVGFYVPQAICSLGLTTKTYTGKTYPGEVIDNLYVYSFKTDIFQKNTPYKVIVDFALHQLSKTYIVSSVTTVHAPVHALNSLVAGFIIDIFISDFLTITAALDSSIYTFGTDTLLGVTNPGPGGYLFQASAGVKINIDSIIERRNLSQ